VDHVPIIKAIKQTFQIRWFWWRTHHLQT